MNDLLIKLQEQCLKTSAVTPLDVFCFFCVYRMVLLPSEAKPLASAQEAALQCYQMLLLIGAKREIDQ